MNTFRFIFPFLCAFFCQPAVFAESTEKVNGVATGVLKVPDRDVQYADKEHLPQWKTDWDQARALYRQGKVGSALVQYELLLQNKNTIEEARWEYTSLLIQEKRWQTAAKELDTLLAREPGNRKYLFARAQVALEGGRAEQAVKLYGQLYEGSPSGDGALVALTGLIAAFDKLGNREAQLPLLEQLLLRKPNNVELLKQAGRLAFELGQWEKTVNLLSKPLQDAPDDIDMLRLVAKAQERLGNVEQAAYHWQQLVALLPGDVEANSWLSKYYRERGNSEMALEHLERQLRVTPGYVDLILTAARLHNQMARPGQALNYYSLYLDLVPEDKKVVEERNRTRKALAADLVTLVEHKKVQQLWQDLKLVTGDREGVYLEMAERFRQEGKERELTEVLLVLYQQFPSDRQIYFELVSLLEEQGRFDEIEKL